MGTTYYLVFTALVLVVGSSSAQNLDREPILDPAALELFNTHFVDSENCWSQDTPPAMILEMRDVCSMDPAAHFTLYYQPPERMAIQGQISLLRFAEHMESIMPGAAIPGSWFSASLRWGF